MVRIPEQINCDAVAAEALASLMESSEARVALPEMSQIETRGLGHCTSTSEIGSSGGNHGHSSSL